jgi:serine/threonine protein kinase
LKPSKHQGVLKPGQLFDNRYLLKRIIGEGGMSQVWLAEDRLLQADYALKIFLSHLNDGKARDTILEEFKILKGLDHGNIIHHEHFGVDRDSDLPYIVTTYYEKGSAASIINRSETALDESVIARFMHDAARSLEYLGSQSPPIVHQDIKPDNFLIDRDGNYLLSDFGISIRKRQTQVMVSEKESSGKWAGDQAYLAPERFKGAVARQAQDIFSLGVTLFEIATGFPPFGEMGGILLSSGAGKPELDPAFGYSRQLQSIIQSCLSLDPDERPTPSELIEKSGFYLQNEFWPVEKKERESAWIPFISRLKEIGSGLSEGSVRIASGAYRLRKPILAVASVFLLFFIVSQNIDGIKKNLASINPLPQNVPVVQDSMTVKVDSAGLSVSTISIEGSSNGSGTIASTTVVNRDTVVERVSAAGPASQSKPSSNSTSRIENPISSVVAGQTVSEKALTPPEEIVTSKPDSKPTVMAQTEAQINPAPVVNIDKTVTKPIRENTPPVITFSQTKYFVFNSQSELLISGFATDDGSISSYEWSQGSNPSRVEFKDLKKGNTMITNINKLKAGKYTLILTVTDNEGLKVARDVELVVRMSRK